MTATAILEDERLFVISDSTYTGSLGFDVVFRRLAQFAGLLRLPSPRPEEVGTLEQYKQYEAAKLAYIQKSPQTTWYEPGTVPAVQKVLESCRESRAHVRLFYGDVATGKDWLEEWEVLGQVSRSTGPLKAPILVSGGKHCGGTIGSPNLLRIMEVASGTELYRASNYQLPLFTIRPSGIAHFSHEVVFNGDTVARFKDEVSTTRWVAFMRGETMKL